MYVSDDSPSSSNKVDNKILKFNKVVIVHINKSKRKNNTCRNSIHFKIIDAAAGVLVNTALQQNKKAISIIIKCLKRYQPFEYAETNFFHSGSTAHNPATRYVKVGSNCLLKGGSNPEHRKRQQYRDNLCKTDYKSALQQILNKYEKSNVCASDFNDTRPLTRRKSTRPKMQDLTPVDPAFKPSHQLQKTVASGVRNIRTKKNNLERQNYHEKSTSNDRGNRTQRSVQKANRKRKRKSQYAKTNPKLTSEKFVKMTTTTSRIWRPNHETPDASATMASMKRNKRMLSENRTSFESRTKRAAHCDIVYVLDKHDPRKCDQFEKITGRHIVGTLNPCPSSGCPQRWPDNTCRTVDHGIEMDEIPLNFCDIESRNVLRYTIVDGKCAVREFKRNGDGQLTTKKACIDRRRKRATNRKILYACLPTCAKKKAGKGVCQRILDRNGWNKDIKSERYLNKFAIEVLFEIEPTKALDEDVNKKKAKITRKNEKAVIGYKPWSFHHVGEESCCKLKFKNLAVPSHTTRKVEILPPLTALAPNTSAPRKEITPASTRRKDVHGPRQASGRGNILSGWVGVVRPVKAQKLQKDSVKLKYAENYEHCDS
uniref:Uncharacterized protein n=1 Tax=Romanomermis culicivorax TaxID=13658 RepID=A0A915HWS1_ROMCU